MNYANAGQPGALSRQDEDQLKVLGILFYVYGALVGLTALLVGLFGVVPALVISSASVDPKAGAAPAVVGGIVIVAFGAFALLFLLKAALMFFAARALGNRRGYTLVMVAACLALLNIPLGTALGVFTILVLQRPAVKAEFG